MSWNRKMLRKLAKDGLTVEKNADGLNVYAPIHRPKPKPYKRVLPPRAERQLNAPTIRRIGRFERVWYAFLAFIRRIFSKKKAAA